MFPCSFCERLQLQNNPRKGCPDTLFRTELSQKETLVATKQCPKIPSLYFDPWNEVVEHKLCHVPGSVSVFLLMSPKTR